MSGLESRRKHDTFLRRIGDWFLWRTRDARVEGVLTPLEFNQHVLKEQMRCARRPHACEFVLVRVTLEPRNLVAPQVRLAAGLRESLRMVDEIAFSPGEIALLLPETGQEGAAVVTERIPGLADGLGLHASIEIFGYPDDDPVAAFSVDLANGEPPLLDPVYRTVAGEEAVPRQEDSPAADRFANSSGYRESAPGSGNAMAVLTRPVRRSVRQSVDLVQAAGCSRPRWTGAATPAVALVSRPTPLWKSAMDIGLSLAGIVVCAPLFLVVAAAIRLSSRGPVFYRQKREGKDGRVFEILKFRTMQDGAEAMQDALLEANLQDGPAFKLKDDPRVTRVGWYLRKCCIDELPQLLNILRRDMSLVGPRPLPVRESRASDLWQRQRLTVLPGLTCLWQVAGDREMKFERWMRLDLEYIRRRSFWLDVRLIFKTLLIALMHRGNT